MATLKPGDIVEIVQPGELYTSYEEFFEEHKLPEKWKLTYLANTKIHPEGKFLVRYIGTHQFPSQGSLAVISGPGGEFFLIGVPGLNLIGSPLFPEVEKIKPPLKLDNLYG